MIAKLRLCFYPQAGIINRSMLCILNMKKIITNSGKVITNNWKKKTKVNI